MISLFRLISDSHKYKFPKTGNHTIQTVDLISLVPIYPIKGKSGKRIIPLHVHFDQADPTTPGTFPVFTIGYLKYHAPHAGYLSSIPKHHIITNGYWYSHVTAPAIKPYQDPYENPRYVITDRSPVKIAKLHMKKRIQEFLELV
jgi:hypothetical protein